MKIVEASRDKWMRWTRWYELNQCMRWKSIDNSQDNEKPRISPNRECTTQAIRMIWMGEEKKSWLYIQWNWAEESRANYRQEVN